MEVKWDIKPIDNTVISNKEVKGQREVTTEVADGYEPTDCLLIHMVISQELRIIFTVK